MLVLTRKVNERLLIGEDIEIVVLGLQHPTGAKPTVKIGIVAPQETLILRRELVKPKEEPNG